ncbi:MAG: hypothetical protein WC587_00575 [Candidatus Paceibacterota bacterium]
MKTLEKTKNGLDEKFQKISKTPAGFDFFMAIHDFVELIELDKTLSKNLSSFMKSNQELRISGKYDYLKKIHQGMKDASTKSKADLGHDRMMVLVELNKIKNNDVSDNNSFWKKREIIRKSTGEIYEILNPSLA